MKLFRISNVLILALASGLGGALFWTSQAVQQKQDTLSSLLQQSRHEQDSLGVLSAEWDYLNRPQRLEELAQHYLKVEPVDEKGIVTDASIIPEPAAPIVPRAKPVIVQAAVKPAPKKEAPKPAVIEKNDSTQFDQLMKSLSGDAP